jgi:hypothetical protein
MDTTTINKLHALLFNNLASGMIRDVAVVFPNGREVSGFVQRIQGGDRGFVLCQHSVLRHEDPLVTVDLTRVREVRVTWANGNVEEFS